MACFVVVGNFINNRRDINQGMQKYQISINLSKILIFYIAILFTFIY